VSGDNRYQIGEPVPIRAEFRDANGVLTNTTVALEVRKPDGTITTPTPTNASAGVYTYTVPAVDQAGLWWYSFIGTGAVCATEQNSFVVEARFSQSGGYPLTNRALVTLEQTREYVLGDITDDSQDFKLVRRINAISEVVYGYTNREWLPVAAATRKFFCRGNLRLVSFGPYDLVAPTMVTAFTDHPTAYQSVLTAPSSTVDGDYRLGPVGGRTPAGTFKWLEFSEYWTAVRPLTFRGFEVTVIGTWGIGTVPTDVQEAVLIAVDNSYKNPEGSAVRNIGPQSFQEPLETYETSGDAPWRALPAESRALLAEYRDDPIPVLV
jgi:hypothetical protein